MINAACKKFVWMLGCAFVLTLGSHSGGEGGWGGGATDVLPTMAYIEKLLLKGYLFFCKGKEIHDLNR